ncbi:MAG TPA: hypothetical protein V6C90_04095 [Coleofasciculaceae cyanobacterium]
MTLKKPIGMTGQAFRKAKTWSSSSLKQNLPIVAYFVVCNTNNPSVDGNHPYIRLDIPLREGINL